MRKLASIQEIREVISLPDFDNLELARVLGWNALVQKANNYKPGDKVVYIEYDSVLPSDNQYTEHWSFLESRKWRVKPYKLRGIVSDGLILPITIFDFHAGLSVGDDVTALLGITKFDNESNSVTLGGDNAAGFPSYVPRTDQERLQTVQHRLTEIIELNIPIVGTLKVDGTSATYVIDPTSKELLICSRNFVKKRGQNTVYNIIGEQRYDMDSILDYKGGRYAIQGEIYGPGIQKNPLGAKEVSFMVFDVYDLESRTYLNYADMQRFCWDCALIPVPERKMILSPASTLGEYTNPTQLINVFLNLSTGNYEGTKNPIEGLVWRPYDVEMTSKIDFSRITWKVINNDYLIK